MSSTTDLLPAASEPPQPPSATGAATDGAHPTPRRTSRSPLERVRQFVRGTRGRLLVASVALLALSMAASLLLVRGVLVADVDTRVESELRQRVLELERFAAGDARVGTAASDVRVEAVFDAFFASSVPVPDEGLYAFVDGVPYLTNARPPAELTMDARLVATLRGLSVPRRSAVETPAGTAEYLAVPVRSLDAAGQPTAQGVFLVAQFPDAQLSRVDGTLTRIGLGLLTLLALASIAAYVAAGRVLAPLRQAIDTARSIQETNLSSRIPVSGSDDIAELGRTFNAMLDRLERVVQLQRDFVSDAGHELRTPITIVRGHLELMTDDPDDRAETLALVTDELDRMSRLVDDLLLLAKAERSDFLQVEPVDVGELLPAVLTKVSALAPREWQLGPVAEATVAGDRQRLTQALGQLAQNATQHSEPGATIRLGAARDEQLVRLWVQDEGEGIEEADQDRIFERFARASTSVRRSDGSGLGLAIVLAIAEAHDGHVELASRRGQGSTFAIVLPIVSTPARHPVRMPVA